MMIPADWQKPTVLPLVTSCKQAARLVSISCERRLGWREWFTMRLHLLMCRTCTFYSRQTRALRRVFHRHEEVLANTPGSSREQLTDHAKARIRNTISRSV